MTGKAFVAPAEINLDRTSGPKPRVIAISHYPTFVCAETLRDILQ